jgi:hypothetical protein
MGSHVTLFFFLSILFLSPLHSSLLSRPLLWHHLVSPRRATPIAWYSPATSCSICGRSEPKPRRHHSRQAWLPLASWHAAMELRTMQEEPFFPLAKGYVCNHEPVAWWIITPQLRKKVWKSFWIRPLAPPFFLELKLVALEVFDMKFFGVCRVKLFFQLWASGVLRTPT